MPNRKQRRRGYSSKKFRSGVESAIIRSRVQNFTVTEIEVGFEGYILLCKAYDVDEVEDVLGVPVVVGETETPYSFTMLSDVPEHMEDPIQEIRNAIE